LVIAALVLFSRKYKLDEEKMAQVYLALHTEK